MKRTMTTLTVTAALLLPLLLLAVWLGGPRPVTRMDSIHLPFAQVDFSDLPQPDRYQARDGTALTFLRYPATGSTLNRRLVLVHGSSSRARSMHVLAQGLATLLSERTADGYVFRVDLRLRPASEVSPLALPFEGAITHYESSALAWERDSVRRPYGRKVSLSGAIHAFKQPSSQGQRIRFSGTSRRGTSCSYSVSWRWWRKSQGG